MWSRTVGNALTTGAFEAEPGVDLCGDVWLGDDFGRDSGLICGVCIGCASESDMVRDGVASAVALVLLLDLLSSEHDVSTCRCNLSRCDSAPP